MGQLLNRPMSTLERAARDGWAVWGTYAGWTECSGCGELRYCRSARRARGHALCLECWDNPKPRRMEEPIMSEQQAPEQKAPWEETRERLREQADRDYPQAWIPEQPGDELVGVVTAVRPSVQTAYGPVPVVEVEQLGTRAGWSVWLTHTVLRREMIRRRPMVGETVLIRYLGRVQPETGGAAYEAYRVVVDRPDENSDIDWHGLAERYGEPDDATAGSTFPPEPEGEDIPF